MISLSVLVFSFSILVYAAATVIDVEFPPWFQFGASSSAYQVEGAWNVSDKGESIWDRFIHEDPTVVSDLTNGDVACDSYHLWQRDVEMAAELGLHFYRFSIAWTRLLPTGYSNVISEDGKRYYNNLIDALLERGIEPVVTLYHFDLPQSLQNLGGWTNPLIADWFSSYARVAFTLFGDRVKTWFTINEPNILCDLGFASGALAPGYSDSKIAPFLCTKYVLLAHAKAWRIYDTQFKPLYHGKVAIVEQLVWLTPVSFKDSSLTKLAIDYSTGRHCHPIYSKEGGWPATTKKLMREVSYKEGYADSRLPDLSAEEIDLIRGTYDYFALNYYTCRIVRRAKPGEKVEMNIFGGIPELNAVLDIDVTLPRALYKDNVLCPKGLREQMAWLKENYGDMEILITETGIATSGRNLKDDMRKKYIRDHLEQVLLSIKLDGVNVTGFTYWTLMDNFEWIDGYQSKFGLYEVDFESDKRTRTPRSSALYYSNIIRSHSLRINSSSDDYFYIRRKKNYNAS